MKNYPNLFPLIFILLFSCSQSTKESAADKEVETDLKKENLKGDVVLVSSNTLYTEDESPSAGIDLKVYNEKGMMTKQFSGIWGITPLTGSMYGIVY
jgi:hypothetical protein